MYDSRTLSTPQIVRQATLLSNATAMSSHDVLAELSQVLRQRKGSSADESYVARLYAEGIDKILKKVGEEATETVIAAKDGDREAVIRETADLWFHTMVMLTHLGVEPIEVLEELAGRFGTSGLVEKAARNKKQL